MVNISGFLCHRREADPRRHIVWMRPMSEDRDTEAGAREVSREAVEAGISSELDNSPAITLSQLELAFIFFIQELK